jgi:hypothetical protein
MTLVIFHKSFSCEKKIPLSREEKTQKTTSEKKKNDKTNRRLTSSSQDGNTLHPFWRIHSFARKANTLVLFFFVREEIRGVFSRRRF